jgi:hypothetical protein
VSPYCEHFLIFVKQSIKDNQLHQCHRATINLKPVDIQSLFLLYILKTALQYYNVLKKLKNMNQLKYLKNLESAGSLGWALVGFNNEIGQSF